MIAGFFGRCVQRGEPEWRRGAAASPVRTSTSTRRRAIEPITDTRRGSPAGQRPVSRALEGRVLCGSDTRPRTCSRRAREAWAAGKTGSGSGFVYCTVWPDACVVASGALIVVYSDFDSDFSDLIRTAHARPTRRKLRNVTVAPRVGDDISSDISRLLALSI